MDSFEDELRKLLNRHSMESRSNTPDYILANFLLRCLNAFDDATVTRAHWHGLAEIQNESSDLGLYDDLGTAAGIKRMDEERAASDKSTPRAE